MSVVRVTIEPLNREQAEVAVASNPAYTLELAGAYMEWDPALNVHKLGHAHSDDGGSSWVRDLFGSVTDHPQFDYQADPTVAFDSLGRAFFVGIAHTGDACSASTCEWSLVKSDSPDGGVGWSPLQVFREGGPSVGFFHDKPALAIDTASASFRDRIYVAWTRFSSQPGVSSAIAFTYSDDGGATFYPDRILTTTSSPNFHPSAVAVGSDGTVYVSWVDTATGKIEMAKSINGGVSFLTPVEAASGLGFSINADIPAILAVAVDRLIPSLVYLAYSDFPSNFPSPDGEIRFKKSAGGGSTWPGAHRTINNVTSGEQIFPAMSTAPGRIDVLWYDGRRFSQNPTHLDVFYARSLDQGESFSQSRINEREIPKGAGFLGHYIGIASSTSHAFPVWTGTVQQDDLRDMVADRISFPAHGGGGGSVMAGSLITMADGRKLPVQNVHVGDWVQGYDITSGQTVVSVVVELHEVVVDNMVMIRLADGTVIRTDNNPDQKFWVKTSQGTMTGLGVPYIQTGDYLFNVPLRQWVQVVEKQHIQHGHFTMYDILTNLPEKGYVVNDILDPTGCKWCPL